MIAHERVKEWLVTTLLAATWAALVWSASILFNSGIPEFDDAQRVYDGHILPLEQQVASMTAIMALTDSIVTRANTRGDMATKFALDTSIVLQRGLSTKEQESLARAAYHNADSAAVDSAVVASVFGRALTPGGRWYAGVLEHHLAIERRYWNAVSDMWWKEAHGAPKKTELDAFFASNRDLELSLHVLPRNVEVAGRSEIADRNLLAQLYLEYKRQRSRGLRKLFIAALLFSFSLLVLGLIIWRSTRDRHLAAVTGPSHEPA